MSLCGRLSGLGAWAIWTLVACALAPRPQTAAVPSATAVTPAQAAPVRNIDYPRPTALRRCLARPSGGAQVAARPHVAGPSASRIRPPL